METIEFQIEDSKLSAKPRSSKFIGMDITKIKISFEGDFWKNCKSVALFDVNGIDYAAPISNNGVCKLPEEVTRKSVTFFRFKVIGVKQFDRIDTNTLLLIKEA